MPRAVLLLLLAVLCGCGGGGGDTPTATPAPTVASEPGATADPRAAVAARADAIRAELRALRGPSPRKVQHLFWDFDGLALELGARHFKADSRRLQRLGRITTFDGFPAFLQRIERQEWATLVPVWKRYARKLARLKVRGEIPRSTRDFQLAEWRRSTAIMEEFLRRLRREKPASTREGYYQARAFGQASRWPVVIAVPFVKQQRLARGFERDLRKLTGLDELAPRSPSVGDTYRRGILRSFVSPLRKVKRREPIVAAQQWALFRIAELEDTPPDVVEAARTTIALQGLDDARNPYGALRDVGLELYNQRIAGERGLREARRLRTWALKLLARPVPPLLAPMRDDMVAVFEQLDLKSPPKLRKATVAALVATRPSP